MTVVKRNPYWNEDNAREGHAYIDGEKARGGSLDAIAALRKGISITEARDRRRLAAHIRARRFMQTCMDAAIVSVFSNVPLPRLVPSKTRARRQSPKMMLVSEDDML